MQITASRIKQVIAGINDSDAGLIKSRITKIGQKLGALELTDDFIKNVHDSVMKTKNSVESYESRLMAPPRDIRRQTISASSVMVSLLNGRKAWFDPNTFIVVPFKVD